MTFKEYVNLSETAQIPIDEIVKERTVARLIIKNSLNDQAREQLIETYSINNNACYPNTINKALSLLSTFKKPTSNKKTDDDAVVSYHETNADYDTDHDTVNHDDTIEQNIIEQDDIDAAGDFIDNGQEEDDLRVAFKATVMAAVIADAAADDNEDQFIGANFAQLQDVDDVYEDDEPDLVCYVHIVDTLDILDFDDGDEPQFVAEANTTAEEHN
jgi:hypothetical protein